MSWMNAHSLGTLLPEPLGNSRGPRRRCRGRFGGRASTHPAACAGRFGLGRHSSSRHVPMECSPPGSSVHGILQARILEWVAFLIQGSNLGLLHWGQIFYHLSHQGGPGELLEGFKHSCHVTLSQGWFYPRTPVTMSAVIFDGPN